MTRRLCPLGLLLVLLGNPVATHAQLTTVGAQIFVEDDIGLYGPKNQDEFGLVFATGDFDGDGAQDLATGVPYDDNAGGSYPDAGIVIVRYGVLGQGLHTGKSFDVLSQFNGGSPNPVASLDYFGVGLASGDFNGDGYDDLAVGVPRDGPDRGGAVQIHYGSSGGLDLSGSQFFTQDSAGMPDTSESDDQFGATLAAGDFDNDGYDDLAIGAYGEDIFTGFGTVDDGGAVETLYGSSVGLSTARAQYFDQNVTDMADIAEDSDLFGLRLATGDFNGDGRDDLAIGAYGEDDFRGGVQLLFGAAPGLVVTGNVFLKEGAIGLADPQVGDELGASMASGDFDHDGFDDLALGLPGREVNGSGGEVANAGEVVVLGGTEDGLNPALPAYITQAAPGLGGLAVNAFFGQGLAAGRFDREAGDDLAIGAYGLDSGHGPLEGAVAVLYGTQAVGGLSALGDQVWLQDTPGVPGVGEQGDRFGVSLASGDFDGNGFADLVIGAPYESYDVFTTAGAETILYGDWPPLPFADAFESGGAQRWGAASHCLGTCP